MSRTSSHKKKQTDPEQADIGQGLTEPVPEKAELSMQAFTHAFHANIIYRVRDRKIIMANTAAFKLTGYSKRHLLTETIDSIFDTSGLAYRKMIKERKVAGKVLALLTLRKKNGKSLMCGIGSAIFMDAGGIENSIISIYDRSQDIYNQQKIDIEKEKIVASNIVIAKSKQKKIDTRQRKIVADNIVQAKSKQKRIDARLAADEANFLQAFISSSDILFNTDLATGETRISNGYEKSFGYPVTGNLIQIKEWLSHVHPDDHQTVLQNYSSILASKEIEWRCAYRFLRVDQSVASVSSHAIILRTARGKAFRMIGSICDNSKVVVLEERLKQEITLKEKEIAEATDDAKDTERSDIGKELHDNINQLLGASRLYLDLAKQGGDHIEMYLSRCSEYTLTAIEEIRKLTKGLTTDTIRTLGLCEAIEHKVRDTMEISTMKITFHTESFIEDSVNDKFKLNVFRIVQEQLNNILKYAKATKVSIDLLQNKKFVVLKISDNGIGFDTAKKRIGIGVNNIKSRAKFYNSIADFSSQPGRGCILSIPFLLQTELINNN
ncbi:MAG: PAS domain-containing protein [Bacteroidota bacterium]